MKLKTLLSKIDYRLSRNASSRPQYQTEVIIKKIQNFHKKPLSSILDAGGGYDGRYRNALQKLTKVYENLEINKGENVDIVGSIYRIPVKGRKYDLVTMFMVLEHLSKPNNALRECYRVLKPKGLLALTTVQYWHTHSYPSDYYRYTKYGLEFLLHEAGFKILAIWSHGGPFLVIFHAIELNIPDSVRTIYSILFYKLMNWLDWLFFQHEDKRKPNSDSVGWSLIAQKV